MSKRVNNKRGKQGRSKWNTQWMREHGRMSAHRKRIINKKRSPALPGLGFFN